nr:MAG TPA: hypothetical protein [Caudoviricetes sp.]
MIKDSITFLMIFTFSLSFLYYLCRSALCESYSHIKVKKYRLFLFC